MSREIERGKLLLIELLKEEGGKARLNTNDAISCHVSARRSEERKSQVGICMFCREFARN
jgi:hypothetical protein